LRIHIDGEFFCHHEDGITEVDIELLPARLPVLVPDG
jgi:diacylglycerol kinase family enzyme